MKDIVNSGVLKGFYSFYTVKLSLLLTKQADQAMSKRFDLTHSQFSVLLLLEAFGQSSQKTLAEKLNLTDAAISRLTETLANKGYLSRRETPTNRRQNTLEITPLGKRKLIAAMKLLKELETKLYSSIPAHKLKTFIEVSQQLTSSLCPIHS